MAALVQRVRIIRVGSQPLGVAGDQLFRWDRMLFDVAIVLLDECPERSVVDLGLEQWPVLRVCAGIG